ncbi:MAG TPA: hypothetical protein VHN16_05625 [Streptosporangiaceae bacterium]|nr:hypothetical protein [Streptosporangiaceae bacterium]
MTHRKRGIWTRTTIGSAALAALAVLAVQGCAPAAPAAAAHATAAAGVQHDLSIAAAKVAYQTYLQQSDLDAAQGDKAAGLAIVADAQWAQVKGQYTTLTTAGTPVPRYQYSAPQFYVPARSSYPQWFLASAQRRADTNGHLGPAVTTLLVFERAKAALAWTLDGSAALSQGQPMPAMAKDPDGYAVDVSTTDTSLTLTPDVVGATQAAVVDEGPGNPAAAVTGPGPQTTGLYAAQAARARAEAAQGLQYQWLLAGAPFPQFELRLAGGGALVLYGMYLNTTTEHPNLVSGSPIPVPAAFTPLLAAPTEVGYHAVYANWTYQFAAIDPPATAPNAKIDVIASTAGPSYGHAY